MSKDMTTVPYGKLVSCVEKVFGAHLPPKDASRVGECLVDADLRGVASHGITRIPVYTRRLREGLVNSRPSLDVTRKGKATAHVNGDNGMGYVVATRAMEVAIELAEEFGIGMVTASHSNHFGMAASYIKQAFAKKCGAMVLTNAPPLMPVWGGRSPFLGTSPFAIGVPGGEQPLLLDMATSVVAFGKIRRAARLGQPIPADWGLDSMGRSTTNPQAVIDGGVVLPMAGPKGSGLGLMIEAMAGVLSGSAFGGQVRNQNSDFTNTQNVGHCFMAFSPAAFMDGDDFAGRLDELASRAKSSDLAEGFSEVCMPGELEDRLSGKKIENGLEIPASEVEMLRAEAALAGFEADLA